MKNTTIPALLHREGSGYSEHVHYQNFINMRRSLKFLLLPVMAVMAIVVACNKSDEMTADEAVNSALYSIQERGGMGRLGCFELVFPVTLSLPDGTTAEVNSYDEMTQTFRAFFAANGHLGGDGRPQPSFVFPVSVVSQEGALITLNNAEELRRLRAECSDRFGDHDPRRHERRWLSCFEIVFPVNIEFPDGTTAQAADRQALQQLIRIWQQGNPGVDERPQVVFPMTVQMTEDGTLVTVSNREDLRRLKESCN